MEARYRLALFEQWHGGSHSRRSVRNFNPPTGDADSDMLGDLPTLRTRSRAMQRNSPLALGAVNTVVSNVVGTGLQLQSRIDAEALGMDEPDAAAWQKETEREFRLWCESQDCDVTRTQNFYQMQGLVVRSTLESGDCFPLLPMVRRVHSPYKTCIQIIEADRISNPDKKPNTLTIVEGVERDAYGAPIAYHICNTHPGAPQRKKLEWARYEAFGSRTGRRNVLHLFHRMRPGQTRGVPFLAPVIEPLKQLADFTEAELMAAVIDASLTVFVERDIEYEAASDEKVDIEIENGTIIEGDAGEKFTTHKPGRPNTAFDPFLQAILRQIGVALEIPFEVLIKHFTASYSAARSALLEAWRVFRVRRQWLADSFCQPVYEAWLEEAVAIGRIAAPGFFSDPAIRKAYCRAQWQGDGPGAIDPHKEAQAAGERMAIGLTTLAEEIAAYDGGDWEQKHVQQAREHAARQSAGLGKPAAPQSPATPKKETDDESD